MEGNNNSVKVNKQVVIIIWVALIASMFIYFGLIQFGFIPKAVGGNEIIAPVLLSMGVIIAFVSKFMYKKANKTESPQQAFTFYVLSWALAESGAVFGLINYMITGNEIYTYLLFLLGLLTITTNIPKFIKGKN
ncbi:MAG: hypothetical protein ACJAS4_003224 [Bacteriovoracaceae bacterium]|jgi:hypothetical protein